MKTRSWVVPVVPPEQWTKFTETAVKVLRHVAADGEKNISGSATSVGLSVARHDGPRKGESQAFLLVPGQSGSGTFEGAMDVIAQALLVELAQKHGAEVRDEYDPEAGYTAESFRIGIAVLDAIPVSHPLDETAPATPDEIREIIAEQTAKKPKQSSD